MATFSYLRDIAPRILWTPIMDLIIVEVAPWVMVLKDSKQPPHFLDTKFPTTENSVVAISKASFICKKVRF